MSAIRDFRKRHGLTLEKFGESIGVKRAAVWKYENGTPIPTSSAIAIAKATKGEIPLADLLAPEIFNAVKDELERSPQDSAA